MAQSPSENGYGVVALDIDGTLLDSRQRISPRLKKMLARLAGRGVRPVLCTGRRWRTSMEVLGQLDHAHPVVVCTGGALVKRAEDERTLRTARLPLPKARLVTRVLRRGGLVPILLYDRPLCGRELRVSRLDAERAESLPYVRANAAAIRWYDGRFPQETEEPLLVYSMDEEDRVRSVEPMVRAEVGPEGTAQVLHPGRYGPRQVALEVRHCSASKWLALKWLLDRWGVEAARVVAVGDDLNDIPMLEAAGTAVAMGNALDRVKQVADVVTSTNDEDGAARALADLFGE